MLGGYLIEIIRVFLFGYVLSGFVISGVMMVEGVVWVMLVVVFVMMSVVVSMCFM